MDEWLDTFAIAQYRAMLYLHKFFYYLISVREKELIVTDNPPAFDEFGFSMSLAWWKSVIY